MEVIVKVLKLNSKAQIPQYVTPRASGADLYSNENVVIHSGGKAIVGTGIALDIPEGYEGQVRPRSGLAAHAGITVLNSPGTVDSDYRGEIKVILINLGKEPVMFKKGDRIAQLVIAPVSIVTLTEVSELEDTDRGHGGLGSTGR